MISKLLTFSNFNFANFLKFLNVINYFKLKIFGKIKVLYVHNRATSEGLIAEG